MSHPFHYLLNLQPSQIIKGGKFDRDVLKQFHLSHVPWLAAPKDAIVVPMNDGRSLITPTVGGQPPAVHTLNDKTQQWLSLDDNLSIGWEKDDLPTPEILRHSFYGGYSVTDKSSREWSIPVARKADETAGSLQTEISFDLSSGNTIRSVACEVKEFWELSGEIWDYWMTEDSEKDDNWLNRAALAALAVNYAVGVPEVNAFQAMGKPLLDDKTVFAISNAVIDMQFFEKLNSDKAKKNEASEAENSNSTPGDADSAMTSDQPVAN